MSSSYALLDLKGTLAEVVRATSSPPSGGGSGIAGLGESGGESRGVSWDSLLDEEFMNVGGTAAAGAAAGGGTLGGTRLFGGSGLEESQKVGVVYLALGNSTVCKGFIGKSGRFCTSTNCDVQSHVRRKLVVSAGTFFVQAPKAGEAYTAPTLDGSLVLSLIHI